MHFLQFTLCQIFNDSFAQIAMAIDCPPGMQSWRVQGAFRKRGQGVREQAGVLPPGITSNV